MLPSLLRLSLVALLGWSSGSAQAPAKPPAVPAAIVVAIECTAEGTPVPRATGAGLAKELATARRWEGRQLAWQIGHQKLASTEALERALQLLAASPDHRRDSAETPGKKELLPLRIQPGDQTRWRDVVHTIDTAYAAGFPEVHLEGVDTPWLTPMGVDEPLVGDGALIVPKAIFNDPDDRPDRLRPGFDLYQDGRIEHDGATLFTWVAGKEDNLQPLRARLRELRTSLEKEGHLQPRPHDKQQRLDVPFLVRADQWAEWRDVKRLIALATEPEVGFWKLEIAVCHADLEARRSQAATEGAGSDKR
jgi:hypothetical protein